MACRRSGFALAFQRHCARLSGELPPDYVPWLGNGFDGRCCRFLRVEYDALVARTLQGGTDEDILAWRFKVGRPLSDEDIEVWSDFMRKRGLRDSPEIRADLEDSKRKSGLANRDDIDTYLRRHDAEEGRIAASAYLRCAANCHGGQFPQSLIVLHVGPGGGGGGVSIPVR